MNLRGLNWIVIFFVFFFLSFACHAEEYPYRKNYPDVPIIELNEARSSYEKEEAIFLDTRTKMEFDTIHIKGSLHIDFGNQHFLSNLLQVRKDNPEKKIVLYDNGITCLKCYIGVQDATDEGMEKVYAYDGGAQAWAEAYPAYTILMGQQISDAGAELIPYDEFLKISLDFNTFKQKIADSPNAKLIDARDPKQRTKKISGFEKALPIPLDKLIYNVINKGHMKNDQLFIFDQVGRQVRWLMYYLKKKGYKNFYFLNGGATTVLKMQQYR